MLGCEGEMRLKGMGTESFLGVNDTEGKGRGKHNATQTRWVKEGVQNSFPIQLDVRGCCTSHAFVRHFLLFFLSSLASATTRHWPQADFLVGNLTKGLPSGNLLSQMTKLREYFQSCPQTCQLLGTLFCRQRKAIRFHAWRVALGLERLLSK